MLKKEMETKISWLEGKLEKAEQERAELEKQVKSADNSSELQNRIDEAQRCIRSKRLIPEAKLLLMVMAIHNVDELSYSEAMALTLMKEQELDLGARQLRGMQIIKYDHDGNIKRR